MTPIVTCPSRIEPFYGTDIPGQVIKLLDEDATLTQGCTQLQGRLTIAQEWSPVGLFWEFTGSGLETITFGEVQIKSASVDICGHTNSLGRDLVVGHVNGKVEIGSDHKLDRVTFHLADYPDLRAPQRYDDETQLDGKTTVTSWSEIVLEADGWRVRLQPHKDAIAFRRKRREVNEIVLNGVGEISRIDGTQFKRKDVRKVLEALRVFLSFAFAEWSPPLLAVGSNATANKSCQFWGNYDVELKSYLKGWLDDRHGEHLSNAFPGFMARWSNVNWRDPLELAITWLIEATRHSGRTQGAIAFSQIPLEMLAWLIFVEDRTVVDADEFDRLSAASKLQMLLAQCGIPLEVPDELTTLKLIASPAGAKPSTGPQLITKVRNTIIHPNQKNRQILSDWVRKYSVKESDIRWETQQLFRWYITLTLLRLLNYTGEYANRLTSRTLKERVEPVPWKS